MCCCGAFTCRNIYIAVCISRQCHKKVQLIWTLLVAGALKELSSPYKPNDQQHRQTLHQFEQAVRRIMFSPLQINITDDMASKHEPLMIMLLLNTPDLSLAAAKTTLFRHVAVMETYQSPARDVAMRQHLIMAALHGPLCHCVAWSSPFPQVLSTGRFYVSVRSS